MKNSYVLIAELPLIVLAAFGAFAARFGGDFYQVHAEFYAYVLAAIVIKPIVFVLFGMYRRYWQYAGVRDLGVIVLGVTSASLGMAAFVALPGQILSDFPRVVLLTDWLMTMVTAGGLRFAIRLANESGMFGSAVATTGAAPARRILIVGAGAAGSMVVREMRRNAQLRMDAIGFLDDDPWKVGHRIEGIPVLGGISALRDVVGEHAIDTVVIAMPSAKGSRVRDVVQACDLAGVRSQAIPGVFELLDGIATVSRIRNVEIADLLRRSPAGAHDHSAAFVAGRVVLITGGGGSIGYELARQVANGAPAHLVLLGHGENSVFEAAARLRASFPAVRLTTVIADIRDTARLATVFDRVRPSIVFHAAAHKHVPLMEENPEEAVTNNVLGTRNVVAEALRVRCERFVLISTDKAVSPINVMGATKRVAEMIVRRAAEQSGRAFVSVRFGNVLGSRGSVVHTFKRQIEQGGPVTVTDPEMTRFFMTIPEAVHLVLVASGQGRGGELFVLDMGEPVKIVQLAQDLIKLSGFSEKDISIVFSGARTGEKLHEAVFDAGMETVPTRHPEVLQVVGRDSLSDIDLDAMVARLEDAALRGDRAAIEAALGGVMVR